MHLCERCGFSKHLARSGILPSNNI
jgi:hypothetical protein